MSVAGQYIVDFGEGKSEWLSKRITELMEGGLFPDTTVQILNGAPGTGRSHESVSLEIVRRRLREGKMEGPGTLLINAPKSIFLDGVPPDPSPLYGNRIIVTRSGEQAKELSRSIRRYGASVLELPLIEIRPQCNSQMVEEVFAEINQYDWLVFSSANGVRFFFHRFFQAFEDLRSLGLMRIAAVGESTAQVVRGHHLRVDLVGREATAESLVETLKAEQTLDNLKVLVVTGNLNRDLLVTELEKARAIVDTFQVYETLHTDVAEVPAAKAFRRAGADAVVFASPSAVRSFAAQAAALKLAPGAVTPIICSIGPVTSKAIRKLGLTVNVEAEERSVEGIVQVLLSHFG